MKIYWFTSKLNFESAGGSVEEIDFMIRTLQGLGHDVRAVTTHSRRNVVPQSLPYPLIEEDFDSYNPLVMQRRLYRVMKRLEHDADAFVVDGHLFMYGAGAYRLLRGRVPVAAFMNQFMTCWQQYVSSFFPQPRISLIKKLKQSLRRSLERTVGIPLANRVDMFAFVSPTLRTMYEDFGVRHGSLDIVVGDPIDIAQIRSTGNVTEQSYQSRIKRAPPLTIFFSSRMSPGKGFDMLLQGFARVKNQDDFHVILGGTGPEEKHVQKMVRDLGLEKYVTLPGWVTKEQLMAYYREADMFIQADWWPAGTSISLLYALAFGVPSILPGGGGLQWNAGESALYFPYRDPDALARRIEEMGANPDLRARLSACCNERLSQSDVDYPARIAEMAKHLKALRH